MEWHPAINVLFAGAADGNITFWRVNSGECKVLASVGISTEVGKIMPDGELKKIVVNRNASFPISF
jgi:WD40 repeat protein